MRRLFGISPSGDRRHPTGSLSTLALDSLSRRRGGPFFEPVDQVVDRLDVDRFVAQVRNVARSNRSSAGRPASRRNTSRIRG
jgi:hypothetical protein